MKRHCRNFYKIFLSLYQTVVCLMQISTPVLLCIACFNAGTERGNLEIKADSGSDNPEDRVSLKHECQLQNKFASNLLLYFLYYTPSLNYRPPSDRRPVNLRRNDNKRLPLINAPYKSAFY